MSFASPELLLGLLLVPIALIGYLFVQRRRSRYAVRFTNVDLLSNLVPRSPGWRRHLPPVLYLAAISALAIGLARPSMVLAVPREEATIMLTMDVSRSMRATDVDASESVPNGASTPADGLAFVNGVAPRGGLVVLVSDLRGPRDWQGPLAAAAQQHHVLVVEVRDPREDVLPDVGDLTLVDGETGREVRVDTSSRSLRERFAAAASDERAVLETMLRRLGVGHVVLSTDGNWLLALAARLRILGRAA